MKIVSTKMETEVPTDYSYFTKLIVSAMKEQGEPLNTRQEAILAGSLSGLQQLIEAFGLRETIKRLNATVPSTTIDSN